VPASVIKVANRIKYVDLVYVNTVVLLDYLIALRFVRAHKIVHVHEIPTGIAMAIFRALLIWSDADLIFNSQATMKAFHFGKRKRQAVVYNGYHPTGPVTEPVAESPKLCLLLLGRINGWKGADLLVEAISLLSKDEISKIDVRIVGSAYRGQEHYLTDLKKLIAKRDLCDFIEVMPFVSSPESILNWADVLVVPSRKPEPFGRVAIEAMAYSRAVIAARHGGLEEIVVNERTGFLFEPNSAENLANTIRKYLDSRDVVLKHGRAGRQRFQDYFSLSASDSAFIECLQKWAGLGSS
jgi:glycosyltransferase involved in cell wall biosynthesis